MNALAELFGDGGSAQSTGVLNHLSDWACRRDVAGRSVAASALLGILTRPAVVDGNSDRRMPPALRAVAAETKNAAVIAELWRTALNSPGLEQATLDALRRLAENVDGTYGEELLQELVTLLPETPRDRRTMRHEMRRWAEEESAPAIVTSLLARMTE